MSIYGGFATRQHEAIYFKLVYKAMELMQAEILYTRAGSKFHSLICAVEDFDDSKWSKKMLKLYKVMTYFEKMKYLEPFYSQAISRLVRYLRDTYFHGSNPSECGFSTISGGNPINDDMISLSNSIS